MSWIVNINLGFVKFLVRLASHFFLVVLKAERLFSLICFIHIFLSLGNSNIIFNQPNFRVVLKARYNNETMALLDSREGSCIEYKLSGGKLCNKRGTQVWSAQSATWSSLWRQSFDTRHSLLDALNRSHQICPYSCQKPFFPAALNHCLLNDWLNSISTLALRNLFGSYICVDA